MCRWLSIALMLLVWSAQSGLVLLAHDAERDHATAPHDESKCRICAVVHAPVVDTSHPLPQVASIDPVGTTSVYDVDLRPAASLLIHTCRGPPLA